MTSAHDLESEIAETRAELGETVAALAKRADFKSRLGEILANAGYRAAAVLGVVLSRIRRLWGKR